MMCELSRPKIRAACVVNLCSSESVGASSSAEHRKSKDNEKAFKSLSIAPPRLKLGLSLCFEAAKRGGPAPQAQSLVKTYAVKIEGNDPGVFQCH